MVDDEGLRAKLAKVEALFRRAGSPGERAAAEAAMGRLHGRLGGSEKRRPEPEVELQFSLPDTWSVRLFVAVCRKHGVRTFRYARQRRTTVMVRTQERFLTGQYGRSTAGSRPSWRAISSTSPTTWWSA